MAATLAAAVALIVSVEAHPGDRLRAVRAMSYVLVDAQTQRVIDAQWADLDRPLPLGSLIKPFTALAYADTHELAYPTFTCRGSADLCWLPAGHGHVGLADAIGVSCNAYFRQLAARIAPDALVARLQWFGIQANAAALTPAAMVGLGGTLELSPASIVRGYLELVSRAGQPGVSPIVQGMVTSARTGSGRAVGHADALVKTGTAPCRHSPREAADGYTIVIYPADRPRVALLVQAHGQTGAETAAVAGELLKGAVAVR
jgi:cell division protein FtsI/penicillin-binding protein 2